MGMIIKKHVIICLLFIALTIVSIQTRDFSLSLWKDYHLNSPHLIFSHSIHSSSIAFLDRVSNVWPAEYRIAEELIYANFKKNQQSLEMVGSSDNLIVRGLKEGERLSLSLSEQQSYQIILRKNGNKVQFPISSIGETKVTGFDEIVFRKSVDFGINFEEEKEIVKLESLRKLDELNSLYKVNATYRQFGLSILSKTFSQLCLESHKDLSFIGICYNIHQGKRHLPYYKIDIRYSPLIIDRLFGVYPKTSLFLFEELVGLLQDQIFYSDLDFVQIPEHISIIRGFVSFLKSGNYGETDLKDRVKQLLNGLMNQMLLSEVNHLEEEINYRENKKMHPTLIKMISLKWQSHSRKNALSSIYEESFTPDYFYNHANQHIDTCVSKVAWLTAATAEFVQLIKAIGNQDDIDALEQSTSLFRILQQVSGGDSHAKQGRYYSINTAEGVRTYAQQVGYQSFLPYIYELSNIFPQEFLKNVTTPFGLASLNLNHDKFSSRFQFRGNIHLYFNYKILFAARKRLQTSKNQRVQQAIQEIISKIRQKVISFWSQGKAFTSWTVSGQGVRERKGLSLLGLLIMGEHR